MKTAIISFFAMILAMTSFAQTREVSPLKKNAVHIALSGYMMTGPGRSINYDRRLGGSLWASASVGSYPFLNKGTKLDLKMSLLTGKRSSHLEIAGGVTFGRSKALEARQTLYAGTMPAMPAATYIYPAFNLGYRYQKPDGGFIFRAGIGFYEAYFGLGFGF